MLFIFIALPFILIVADLRSKKKDYTSQELCYWVGLCIIAVIGISWMGFNGVRNYRYVFGMASFSLIFSVHYILSYCCKIKNQVIIGAILLALGAAKWHVIVEEKGHRQRPAIEDNIAVLKNELHTADVIERVYWRQGITEKGYYDNLEKAQKSAWGSASIWKRYSFFLVPFRPQITIWSTSIINWNSLENEELIAKDIRDYGLEYVMVPYDEELQFLTPEEYAKTIVHYKKKPDKILFDYGHPEELLKIKW